ncbi:enoyl-CoA hydratase/isomerase family protein [Verticiella sediminum]|uniref:Enoyl-CoA hydratase/isomerase family protein n=1 Tax=Verticiella sediminum TaxID=1247510 RepID=A0A556AWP2_9BURK|nr:enoyl-CoA hydratase/isomerase family protein [Verticiella sediminum]TSH97372.1 enoyl-CoA hydratase/isomerase family protein [Verticiella sediminum]
MSSPNVTLEVRDHIALVALNRPPVNALNAETRAEMIAIFDQINDRDDIRVAVLTGQGDTFCAGADLKDRPSADTPGDFGRHNRIVRETSNSIRECAKPVIAAVNGAALGAGLGLAAACDIIFASENAVFGMPEINVGLAGGVSTLVKLFGRSRTRRMFYTGMRVPAAEMYRLGAVEACVPREQLLDEAMAVASEIAGKSPIAIRYAKNAANMVELMPLRDAYRFEQNFTVELSRTEDAKEARRAFLEKRPPVFQGR